MKTAEEILKKYVELASNLDKRHTENDIQSAIIASLQRGVLNYIYTNLTDDPSKNEEEVLQTWGRIYLQWQDALRRGFKEEAEYMKAKLDIVDWVLGDEQ